MLSVPTTHRRPSRVGSRLGSAGTDPRRNTAASEGEEQERPPPFQTLTARRACAVVNHDCIRQSSLFAGRDELFLRRLKEEMYVEVFQAGDYIMREGEEGTTLCYMNRGQVNVLVGPTEHLVATLGDGSVFGELALLGVSNRRTATIRAVDFCDCRFIDQRRFLKALQSFPKERASFQQLADQRLKELEEKKREQEELERRARMCDDAATSDQRRASVMLLEGVFRRIPACVNLQRRRRAFESAPSVWESAPASEANPESPLALPDVGMRRAVSDGRASSSSGRPAVPEVPPAVAPRGRAPGRSQFDSGEATTRRHAAMFARGCNGSAGQAGAGARAAGESDREDVLRRALPLVPVALEPLTPNGRQPKAERHKLWSRRLMQAASTREPTRGPYRSHEAVIGAGDD